MLIRMQKINFITHFFLKILQRNSKPAILDNLGMPCHKHLKRFINLKKPLIFICRQKVNYILHVFLKILQRHCRLVILGTLGMPRYVRLKWYYYFVENVSAYLQSKTQLYFPCFSGDIATINKILLWVIWACLATHKNCLNGSEIDIGTSQFFFVTWVITPLIMRNSSQVWP